MGSGECALAEREVREARSTQRALPLAERQIALLLAPQAAPRYRCAIPWWRQGTHAGATPPLRPKAALYHGFEMEFVGPEQLSQPVVTCVWPTGAAGESGLGRGNTHSLSGRWHVGSVLAVLMPILGMVAGGVRMERTWFGFASLLKAALLDAGAKSGLALKAYHYRRSN